MYSWNFYRTYLFLLDFFALNYIVKSRCSSFTDAQYSIERIYHKLFILPLSYMKGFFKYLDLENNATINTHTHPHPIILLRPTFLFVICLREKLLDHSGVIRSSLVDDVKLFSRVAVPIYNLPNFSNSVCVGTLHCGFLLHFLMFVRLYSFNVLISYLDIHICKVPIYSCPYFSHFCFFLLWICGISLHIFGLSPLLGIHVGNITSHSLTCLFMLLMRLPTDKHL